MDISAEPKCKAKFVFNCMDIYTRYLISVLLKNKSQSECVRGLKVVIDFVKSHNFQIQRLDSDSESGFKSKEFQKILKQNHIEHHFVEIGDKQGVAYAERVNGTLRGMIQKYKSSYNRYNLDSVIPLLVKNYNTTIHSITKSTPEDALKDTKEYHERRNEIIKQRLAKAEFLNRNNQELNIGDTVRLKIIRSIFEKGSNARFTKTIHKILAINRDGSFRV